MWRVATSTFLALTFFASIAAAQQPCTTDAGRVVNELYRHMLERAPDPGAQHWQNELTAGRLTVREVVLQIAVSDEHQQRFGQTEPGEGTAYERAVARLYRHVLGRQPDPEGQRSWAQNAQINGLRPVAEALVSSDEYTRNFGDWAVPGSGGVRFCGPATRSSAAPAPRQVAPQANQGVTDYRFRGMDRNRDGRITQNEWQGSRQSFQVHDWDGNGVLEGDEVRAGAFRQGRTLEDEDLDRDERFEFLDANGNNRIERREWHASIDQFNRIDRNRDGALSRAELDAAWGVAADTSVGTTGNVVIVDSRVRWTDTGITVRAGDTLTFDADGRINMSDNPGDFAQASGSESGRRASNSPVPSAPAGGLIARIGNRDAVYVGDRQLLRAPANGRLFLGVNDDHLNDNQGNYRVTITVR